MLLPLRKCNFFFFFWVVFIHIDIVNFPWEELPDASGGGGDGGQRYPTDQSAMERGTAACSKNPLQGKEQTLKNPTAYVCTAPRCNLGSFCVELSPAVMLGADRGTGDGVAALLVAPHGCSGAVGYGCSAAPRQGSYHAAWHCPLAAASWVTSSSLEAHGVQPPAWSPVPLQDLHHLTASLATSGQELH